MSITEDILAGKMPNFQRDLPEGETLDDYDHYGFTPLIECAIAAQTEIAKELLSHSVDINKADLTGRTALHWAVDMQDLAMIKLLLEHGADPNAYTRAGMAVLVFPVLRADNPIKQLLYKQGAKLDFALDFIFGKLLGHRFELKGDVDIVSAKQEFVELDYEGFILEFSVALVKDSLRRFTSSFSTRHLRQQFDSFHQIMDAFTMAEDLLKLQHPRLLSKVQAAQLNQMASQPFFILPAASEGHALCFVRYQNWWAKIDRGANSKEEGSVNIYQMTKPEALNGEFLHQMMLRKQNRRYFHQIINQQLGLQPRLKMPLSAQIAGNCSWANVQGIIPVAYALLSMQSVKDYQPQAALKLYEEWIEWDKDRAIDESIQRFYQANPLRKASLAAMLASVLFQACDYDDKLHLQRAEKILEILTLPDYVYILNGYLDEYCVKRLTYRGNNLLKILDECNVNPNIGVTAIATGLKERE